jgi:hypothetical protein
MSAALTIQTIKAVAPRTWKKLAIDQRRKVYEAVKDTDLTPKTIKQALKSAKETK